MTTAQITVEFAPELRVFAAAAHRDGRSAVRIDSVSTLGHVVESLGVPLTEVGTLLVDGRPVAPAHLPADGEAITDCARTYWKGAHHARLDAIVTHTEQNFGTRTGRNGSSNDAETFLAQLD